VNARLPPIVRFGLHPTLRDRACTPAELSRLRMKGLIRRSTPSDRTDRAHVMTESGEVAYLEACRTMRAAGEAVPR
jgi:hypothetical protein